MVWLGHIIPLDVVETGYRFGMCVTLNMSLCAISPPIIVNNCVWWYVAKGDNIIVVLASAVTAHASGAAEGV